MSKKKTEKEDIKELKKLPPKERMRRLRELQEKKKKELKETKKLLEQAIDDVHIQEDEELILDHEGNEIKVEAKEYLFPDLEEVAKEAPAIPVAEYKVPTKDWLPDQLYQGAQELSGRPMQELYREAQSIYQSFRESDGYVSQEDKNRAIEVAIAADQRMRTVYGDSLDDRISKTTDFAKKVA